MSIMEIRNAPAHIIKITHPAVNKIAELLAKENDNQLALRIAVKPGGCSGMSYEIYFDAETNPDDHQISLGTIKVRIDPTSANHLAGATLNYKDGLQDAGFSIDNPNAQSSCGCGASFS